MGRKRWNLLTDDDILDYQNRVIVMDDLVAKYHASKPTIKRWLRERGVEIISKTGRRTLVNILTPEDAADYVADRVVVDYLCQKYHANRTIIYRWLRERGVDTLAKRGSHYRAPRNVARNAEIVAMCRAGCTLREIGEKFNITKERVRQLYRRLSGDTKPRNRRGRAGARTPPNRLTAQDIIDYQNRDTTMVVLAKKHHAAVPTVRRWLIQAEVAVRSRKTRRRTESIKRADEIIARYGAGESVDSIRKDFGLKRARIYHIIGGRYPGGRRAKPDEDHRLVGNRQKDKRLAKLRAEWDAQESAK